MPKIIVLFVLLCCVLPVAADDNGIFYPAPTPEQSVEDYARLISLDAPATQHDLSQTYNLCHEFLHRQSNHWLISEFPARDYYVRPDLPPCYNDSGQRLKFYVSGEPLTDPIYSDMPVHVTQEGETLADISLTHNTCIRSIRNENEHISPASGAYYSGDYASSIAANIPLAIGQEIFVPQTRPCYDDEGRLLRYEDDGTTTALAPGFWVSHGQRAFQKRAYNICFEDVLAANGVEQSSELVDVYGETGIRSYDNLLEVWYPLQHDPCYYYHQMALIDGMRVENMTHAIGNALNICPIEVHYAYPEENDTRFTFSVPIDATPCDASRPVQHLDTAALLQILTALPIQQPAAIPVLPAASTPVPIATATPMTTPEHAQATLNSGANIRSGPGVDYHPPVGSLMAGSRVDILAIDATGMWYRIPFYNGEGWISSTVVEVTGDLSGLPREPFVPTPIPVVTDIVPATYPVSSTQHVYALSFEHNICMDDILSDPANEELAEASNWQIWQILNIREVTVTLPADRPPCYEPVAAPSTDAAHLAQVYNVCEEVLRRQWVDGTFYIPLHDPCYDENGHRLSYFDRDTTLDMLRVPVRVPLDIYIAPRTMSLFELSQQLNVCIDDLQRYNVFYGKPMMVRRTYKLYSDVAAYAGQEIIVPDTRPCYHDTTGNTLLYTDAEGNLLETPLDAGAVLTYFHHSRKVSSYYNVCINRVLEYNVNFLSHEVLSAPWAPHTMIMRIQPDIQDWQGFIVHRDDIVRIPRDRPACYDYDLDEVGLMQYRPLRYACYNYPLDMTQSNPDAIQNIDGDYCYDVDDPDTVIWEAGEGYVIQPRTSGVHTVDYLAWCYGVDSENIIAHADNDVYYIAPYQEVLMPLPTRTCYLREDDGAEIIHYVEHGETIRSLAWQYGKLPVWIINANDLAAKDLIWTGQRLVIPYPGVNLWHYVRWGQVAIGFLAFIGLLVVRRRRLNNQKAKRKNDKKAKV